LILQGVWNFPLVNSVEFLIEKTATEQFVVKFHVFMEPEDSLLCSGNLTAVPCIADDKSVLYTHAVGHCGTFCRQIL